jgi:hypothetical protein
MNIQQLDLGYYVERNGILVPATIYEWGEFYEDLARRIVRRTIVSDTEIITICTGHNFELTVPPSFYSTGVFGRRKNEQLGAMKREWFYSTRQAAESGHARIVDAVRRGDRLGVLRLEHGGRNVI